MEFTIGNKEMTRVLKNAVLVTDRTKGGFKSYKYVEVSIVGAGYVQVVSTDGLTLLCQQVQVMEYVAQATEYYKGIVIDPVLMLDVMKVITGNVVVRCHEGIVTMNDVKVAYDPDQTFPAWDRLPVFGDLPGEHEVATIHLELLERFCKIRNPFNEKKELRWKVETRMNRVPNRLSCLEDDEYKAVGLLMSLRDK